ncbi:MAG: hypothetical protein AAB723_02275 [Patescibacteria group bacterium]
MTEDQFNAICKTLGFENYFDPGPSARIKVLLPFMKEFYSFAEAEKVSGLKIKKKLKGNKQNTLFLTFPKQKVIIFIARDPENNQSVRITVWQDPEGISGIKFKWYHRLIWDILFALGGIGASFSDGYLAADLYWEWAIKRQKRRTP